MYLYRYICVCDVYCYIDTCIMYVICVLFDNLSNIHMYCLCICALCISPVAGGPCGLSSSWPGSSDANSTDSSGCLISAGTSGDFPEYFAFLLGCSAWYLLSVIWGCVPSHPLLAAETPCDPWPHSGCYHFISPMPSPLSLWHPRCLALHEL